MAALGCLNVCGYNNLDKRERIERFMDHRKLDVLAISKTKLKGSRKFRCKKARGTKEKVA